MVAQQVHADEDRRQGIVQIMGDAAGERADAFQAPGALDLLLNLLTLGEIGVDDEDGLRGLMGVPNEFPAAQHGNDTAILAGLTQFPAPFARFHQFSLDGGYSGNVILVIKLLKTYAPGFLGGPSKQLFGSLVPVADAAIEVAHINGVGGQIEQGGLLPDAGFSLKALFDFVAQFLVGARQLSRALHDTGLQGVMGLLEGLLHLTPDLDLLLEFVIGLLQLAGALVDRLLDFVFMLPEPECAGIQARAPHRTNNHKAQKPFIGNRSQHGFLRRCR